MSDKKQLVIIGAGPGGYTAAFAAADLGLEVTLIDKDPTLGGVCLNRGCIPTKALLHVAQIIRESRGADALGVSFKEPEIKAGKIAEFKDQVVKKLTGGLAQLAKQRKVEVIRARAVFKDSNTLELTHPDGKTSKLIFEQAILATGSVPARLPFLPESDQVWDSRRALKLDPLPENLLIIGGGYIGMEFATIYQALGSRVTVVEMTSSILPGADRDLVLPLQKWAKSELAGLKLSTKVTAAEEKKDKINVTFEDKNASSEEQFDAVLVAVGRTNPLDGLGLEAAGIELSEDKKFIQVNAQRRTSAENIYAIGDITGQPMLAHKASAEGRVAAEAAAGHKTGFDVKAIPAVVFTLPEIAWCGITEAEAKDQDREITVSKFPWAASGRAITLNNTNGVTKVIADAKTKRILGVAIAGPGAGEMISEGVLAVEMGALAEDMALSIHPHPTLSETLMEAAEGIFGQSTHIYRKQQSTG